MLDLDKELTRPIHRRAFHTLRTLPRLVPTQFPSVTIDQDGDRYFQQLWNTIDSSKDYIWMVMYHFDDTRIGKITLHKLTEAAKRGVNVCIMHDVLTSELDRDLRKEFNKYGGLDYRLNAMHRIWNIPTRRYFKRDHEKLIVADNKIFLGSANISVDYAHKKHGVNFFYDLNMWGENVCLDRARHFMGRVADWHQVKLTPSMSNEEAVKYFSSLYPSSPYAPTHWKVMGSFQPDDTEIQEMLVEQIRQAKDKIMIVSPYYYPVKKIDKELLKAVQRGVKVELITARRRDIPSYRDFKNANLMNHLVKNGVNVLQVKDKYLHMKGILFDDKVFTFGSFNLDKWSWDNNNEFNFTTQEPEHIDYFKKVYSQIKQETVPVENSPVTLRFMRRIRIFFWESFLSACNFVMNYRNKYKYEAKEVTLRKLWREEILGGKKAKKLPIPEDSIRLYKCVNFEWDDTIGIEH